MFINTMILYLFFPCLERHSRNTFSQAKSASGKIIPVHPINAHTGIRGITPFILSLEMRRGWITSRRGFLTPGKEARCPINRGMRELQRIYETFRKEKISKC
jgi:hypothetical protein